METIIKYSRPKNTNNRGQNNVTIINNGGGGSSSSDIDFSNIDNYLHWKKSVGQFSLVPRESYNQAEGDNSIAVGEYTQTINNGELAIGMFNKPESGETYLTIGNGTDDINRSNLFSVGKTNTVVNNHLSGKTAFFSTNVVSPTVSGTNAVFDTGVFYSGITSNSAIINNISGDTVVLSQSLTAPTISGNSIIGNNISGTNASITSLTATAITSNTINVTNKLTTNQLEAVSGYIKTLLSDEITVDYLTVTKAAHFFKLLIDEIKATQGQIIITPCNAVIDKVETVSGNYRCYFRAKDDDREINNNFEVNDQVVCQTFNVATGVSYNVSNTYYWRLCVATGTTSTTIDGETVECHYIDLSNTDKDSYSNSAPAKGDNVVQLGNRNDTTRQAAIIISAYNQQFLDPTIKAPSIVQYQGINDYSLQNHRKNVISKDFNEFVGNFKTSTGDDIEELIEDVTSGITAYLHTAWANSADGSVDFTKNPSGGSYAYVGFCSNNTQSDTNLVYSDYSWSYVKGADGTNGTNGTDGTDGVDGISITGVTEYYLISSSSANITTATTGWQTTFIAPTPQKKYLWNYEENHFSDGTTAKTIPVIIGNYATDGTNGTNGTNGEDGRGISSITEYYLATSASGNVTTATTGWSTTVQKMTATKKYLWNYELITYTDNTTSKTEPVIIGVYGDKGNKGDSGTSVTVSSTSITYAVTTSSTQPNDNEFTYNSIPSLSTGDFLWCKTVVNYSNGTTTKSYSVSRIGADGTNGTNGTNGTDGVDSYLHIAYSYSSDGSSGFSTTYFNGALYIGTCTNSTQSDPQTYTSYTWARLKGEKGDSGTSVTITATSITYAVTTNSTQPADNKFTYSSIPTVAVGNYLWCKTIVSYSNGTSTKSYSVSRVGADGTNGTNGTNGTDGKDSYLHIAYALSANGSSGFSTTYFAGALYIGTCTNDSATDPQTYTSYTWARLRGEDGEDGQSGTSISISSTSVTYAVTTTATQPTDNKFTYTSIPTVAKGSYLWTKTIVTYSDGSFTKTYTVSYKGIDGNNGTSITISSTSVTYAVTTANTQPADSAFTATTVPTVPKGSYLWTKTVVTYSDGTVTKTYSVSYKGTDGDKGDTGDDAEFYRLVPVIEKAIVDKNGTLGVQFSYQIAHVSGSSVTTVTATTSGYWVRVKPNNTNTYYNLSTNTTTPNYTNTSFITNYHKQTSKPTYFTVYLVSGSSAVVKDQKTVSVIFDAGATLEVTDEINATVQGHSETISSHTNSIATLNANYNSITTTVQSNTNNISNLSGTVTSHTSSISQLQQTSSEISSTITSISDGDTRNLFYPSCYSSDGMTNAKNQWILTDVLDGTVRCSSWGSSSMKNGKPIVNGWVSAEMSSTGEIYLYSPYISLNKNYKYSLTFEGQVYNYCYLEICHYTSQAKALSATSNIASVQSLATLGYSTNQYTYNESIFTFTPSTTSSYNRIRFRLTSTNSNTPVLDLKKISLYKGTTSAGISTGGFAPWIDSVSKLTSQITQKSEEINIGLNRAGINLTSGKITSVADNFEWINNEGETVLGLDSNGDANFNGTVRAKNLYKTLALASNDTYTLVLTPEGTTTVWIYVNTTFTCEENGKTYTAGHYYEIPPTELSELYYYPSDAGYYKVITGPADEVIVVSGPYPNGSYYVVLPKSSDYVGKAVTIRHTIVSGKTVTVTQCDGSYNAFSHDGISIYDENNDHTPDIIYGSHMDDDFSISYGQTVTFYSVGLYWIRLHVSE